MDPLNNFKNYRNLIKYHVELNNDVIPCQEIILKDLLYHYEQFVLPKYKNYIDLKRVNKIGSIIDLVRQCKKISHQIRTLRKSSIFHNKIRTLG